MRGHPWIYRSDVTEGPDTPGIVSVLDPRGRFMGQGLWSPKSEIRLRLLDRTDAALVRVTVPLADRSATAAAHAGKSAGSFVQSLFPALERHLPS